MDLGLSGAVCIVTGADSGIGAATARLLCEEGASVMLSGLNADPLQAVAVECRATGADPAWTALDLTAAGAAEQLVQNCRQQLGAVDVLVNCAGRTWFRSTPELTDEDLYAQWELNVMALTRLLRLVAPEMAARGGGRIVSVSSVSAKQPSAVNVAYAATKTAQVALMRGYAEEYSRHGVIINSILPGPVDTPLWRAANDELGAARGVSGEEIARQVADSLPRRRVASTDELARVIAFLASPLAANVIGAAWTVDGGSARQLF